MFKNNPVFAEFHYVPRTEGQEIETMSELQELSIRQIDEALKLATQKQVPATITIPQSRAWVNYPSRMLAMTDTHLLIELPLPEANIAPHEFTPAEKLGLSFKLKHYKHLVSVTVAGIVDHRLGDVTMKAISLCLPTRMQRLQRRAFLRVDVPANRVVRASFWMGGRNAEPQGPSSMPVWTGRITNLSAGGFQLVCPPDRVARLDVGENIGVRIAFGSDDGTVYADAQFRHVEENDQGIVMGFQFLGLAQTPEGKEALRVISNKVAQFQSHERHHAS